jgi:prophage maintenance system killer protein
MKPSKKRKAPRAADRYLKMTDKQFKAEVERQLYKALQKLAREVIAEIDRENFGKKK